MPRDPHNMQNSSGKPSPREYDNRRRGSASHFPQFYDQVDQNVAQRSPTRDPGRTSEVPFHQPGNQRRHMPVEQRPPVINNTNLRRGATNGASRPPSYPGPPSQLVMNKTEAVLPAQQERRRGSRRADESNSDSDHTNPKLPPGGRNGPSAKSRYESNAPSNQSLPVLATRTNPNKNGPDSPTGRERLLDSGNAISRVQSPSVMKSVLQPLDRKIHEYDVQMSEAQTVMAQLDAEMSILQERRREAENRYMSAKNKHDDYHRQYQDVERALRGELGSAFSSATYENNVFSAATYENNVFSAARHENERPSTQGTVRPTQILDVDSRQNSRADSWGSLSKPKLRWSKLFSVS